MATKKDLDFAYSTIDKIFRLSFGEMSDFSGAKYDGGLQYVSKRSSAKKT